MTPDELYESMSVGVGQVLSLLKERPGLTENDMREEVVSGCPNTVLCYLHFGVGIGLIEEISSILAGRKYYAVTKN